MQLARRMMAQRTGGVGGDIAVVPFFSQDGSVELLTFASCMPAAIWQARGEVRGQQQAPLQLGKGCVMCKGSPVNAR